MATLQDFENAIAQEEGYNVQGSLPQTLNNPGDLTSNGSLLSFPTPQAGWDALTSKLQNIASGNSSVYPENETLAQFENTYTNGDPNAANNVASILGVSPSTTLQNIFNNGAGSTGDNSSSSVPGSVASAGASAASGPLGFLISLFGSGTLSTSDYLIRGVAIASGLILIAGAVFGFDKVQQTVIDSAKGAAVVSSA
jgi:hypothetical protein